MSFHWSLGLPSGLFPSGFPAKILYAFLVSPSVLLAPRIWSFFTWSFRLFLAKTANYESLHYAIFSSLLPFYPSSVHMFSLALVWHYLGTKCCCITRFYITHSFLQTVFKFPWINRFIQILLCSRFFKILFVAMHIKNYWALDIVTKGGTERAMDWTCLAFSMLNIQIPHTATANIVIFWEPQVSYHILWSPWDSEQRITMLPRAV
jgi:hypothetical protein